MPQCKVWCRQLDEESLTSSVQCPAGRYGLELKTSDSVTALAVNLYLSRSIYHVSRRAWRATLAMCATHVMIGAAMR